VPPARVAGDDTQAAARAGAIADELVDTAGPVTVRAGGEAIGYHEITGQVTRDLARSELVAIPVTALLLVFIFGSVVAALIPLTVGVVSILVTMGILRLLSAVTDVSVFAMNLRRQLPTLAENLKAQFGMVAEQVTSLNLAASRGSSENQRVRTLREGVAQVRQALEIAATQTKERHAVKDDKGSDDTNADGSGEQT